LDSLGLFGKFPFAQVDRKVLQVCQRHPRRQVPGDLISVKCYYANKSKSELAIPLDVSVPFNLKNTATVDAPEPAPTKPYEKDGAKTRYFAKVMIFGGILPEDEKLKGKVHLVKRLNFLIARKEHGSIAPIGGEWSAEKDGATPNDATLQKTAIRAAKELVGLDLSKCKQWQKFLEYRYKREDGTDAVTVIFVPNVWDQFSEGIEPATQVKEETKDVKEEVEEEIEDPEDASKKKTVKKQVTVQKQVKVTQWRPHEMNLQSMLEYDCNRPSPDEVLEICLFADCFHEMLQRDIGLQVIEILNKKKVEAVENEKKRKREEEVAAAEKKAKTEAGEAAKEEPKKEEPKAEPAAAKPKTKLQHTVNQEILQPFQFFDRQPHTGAISGSLRREVLEGVLHQYATMTKREIDELLQYGAGLKAAAGGYNAPPSILYYVKLATTTTEVPVEDEKPAEKAEDKAEGADDSMAEEGEGAKPEDGAMTEEGLNKLLLKDLRTMCENKNLSTAGKKAELIERLLKGK